MRYRIHHRTEYDYSETVAICKNQVRMQPRSQSQEPIQVLNLHSGTAQADMPVGSYHRLTCYRSLIRVEPKPTVVSTHIDYFGNPTYSFAIEYPHQHLNVDIASDVEIAEPIVQSDSPSPSWESVAKQVEECVQPAELYASEFVYPSRRIELAAPFRDYALKSFQASRSIVESALDLTKRIHADFEYDSGATDVHTSTAKAFDLRAGVCQDFAHVQIACLRSIGIPARYVSGYLRTVPPEGKERLIGADESHAWLSVYGGAEIGWFDCDPTNASLPKTDHIPICVGRDYSDVTPIRGVLYGGGQPALKVSVDVKPMLA